MRSTLAVLPLVACVFVHQALQSWEYSVEGGWNVRKVALLMMIQVVFCMGMLANLVQERKRS